MDQQYDIEDGFADSYSLKFQIIYSDSGKLKAVITGDTLEQYFKTETRSPYDEMKDSVHLKFYNKFEKVETELMADYAIRYPEKDEMHAKGNVVVFNKKGERLDTERLTWNEKTRMIHCDTTVVITKPGGQKIVGSSLVSDEKFENYKITQVTGKLQIDEREEAPE